MRGRRQTGNYMDSKQYYTEKYLCLYIYLYDSMCNMYQHLIIYLYTGRGES